MRILLIGAGEVGVFIADRLVREGHDLVVIDTDAAAIARVNELDVFGVVGDGTDPRVLREQGIDHTDLLIAASQTDSVNLTACAFAGRLGVTRSIARLSDSVRDEQDERLARETFGIDYVINPDEEAAREVEGLLEGRQIIESVEFDGGRVRLVGVRVDEGSLLADKNLSELRELHEGARVLVVAMVRDGNTIIPGGNHHILPGDRLYMIGARDDLARFVTTTDEVEGTRAVKRVLVVGGGRVGVRMCLRLQRLGHDVRLLEANRERSEALAAQLEKTTILCGDGTDLTALRECGAAEVDAFIAVSGDEETNVMSALLARHLGASKVVALVKRVDYIPILKEIGLDAAVNPRLTAAGAILRFVRRGHVLQVTTFRDIEAEALEMAAGEKSRIVGKPLKNLSIPRDAIIGGYSRGGRFEIADGETILEPHDHVIVFALPSAVPKVEKMFS